MRGVRRGEQRGFLLGMVINDGCCSCLRRVRHEITLQRTVAVTLTRTLPW